jgi:hypothetical protein
MATSRTEYKFPDEQDAPSAENASDAPDIEVSVEGDVDIEVADDTPEEDRGRRPLEKEPDDPKDEELATYSASVQKRIKELSHARHDERRAKEALQREQEEMKRISQRLVEENIRLKQYVSTGEQAYAGSMKSAAEAEYEIAKKQFKDAHESFDADALIEAQAKLTQAQLKLEKANNFRPTPLQTEKDSVETQQIEQPQVRPDEKTLRWQQRNQWFGPDDEMTAVALIAHKQLVQSGVDPRSDEYFAQIDARMRRRFPDFFNVEKEEPTPQPTEVRKAANVVAPASRSSGPKKITLTRTQVAIAKKLGVPLEMYAKQLAQENA